MRKTVLVLLLIGCASEPRGPTDAHKAMWSYWAGLCGQKADAYNIEYLLRTDAALRGCVTMYAVQADAMYGRSATSEALTEFGTGLQNAAKVPSGSSCTSRPDGLGGIRTSCY